MKNSHIEWVQVTTTANDDFELEALPKKTWRQEFREDIIPAYLFCAILIGSAQFFVWFCQAINWIAKLF